MKIALAQTAVAPGGFEKNLSAACDTARRAKEAGAELAVFPEMFLCGFNYAANLAGLKAAKRSVEEELGEIAKSNEIALCGSVPHLEEGDALPSNRLVMAGADGALIAHYDKTHLFGLLKEDKFVKPGNSVVVADTPFGRTGFAVCYDLRFPEIFSRMAVLGAKIIIISAAFPHPRSEHWKILIRARAVENQCFVAAVNRAGSENFGTTALKYFGLSAVVDPWGRTVAECRADGSDLAVADIDLGAVEKARELFSSSADRRDDLY